MSLLLKIWYRLDSDDCADLAAQVSFYFVLSIFPFFLVLASLLGWIPTNMLELSHGYASFLSIGLLATLWSASSGFTSLMEALSIAHAVKDSRSYFRRRAIAVCAKLVAALFLILTFALWNFGHVVAGWATTDFGYLILFQTQWKVGRWLVTLLLLFFGIDLVNYFLPAEGRPWKWVTPGTALVATALAIATLGFNFYVAHGSNIPRIYGALAGFIVMMLWIYAANLILLIGAETDTALGELRPYGAGT